MATNTKYWISHHHTGPLGRSSHGTYRDTLAEATEVYANYRAYAPTPCIVKVAQVEPNGDRKTIARVSVEA